HALLRGMQIVKSKSEKESEPGLENSLNSSDAIEIYFGENGVWRQDIIARRKDQELKKALHEKFISTLKSGCDNTMKNLYKSALGFLEDKVVAISKDLQGWKQQYEFTDQAIQSDLAKSLEILRNERNADLVNELKLPEQISSCFDLEKMRNELLSDNFLLDLPLFRSSVYNRADLKAHFKGEWLDDGELEYLWEHNKTEIVPQSVRCGFKAIPNFDLVDNPDRDPEFDELAFHIKNNIKPFLNKNQELFQIFALGTMRQTGEAEGTKGHWYPLVMHQNKEGKRVYYITDSYKNKDRWNDFNAWKVINLIES
ncbi:MAG: hypothetical protein ABI892_13050, partial [Flavobacterium sp.]